MNSIHEGLPYRDFVKPQTGLVSATICAKSGLLPTSSCTDGTKTLYYLEGTQPHSYCEYHENVESLKRLAIDRLQTESLSVGQKPIIVDTTGLMLDPDIFTDPVPTGVHSESETETSDMQTQRDIIEEGKSELQEPAFNPLLE
ncbi:MAG: hypothetical protein BWY39_01168 [Spirochaetes bacterium ADurb.Bin269]|nr:MAG: hypothetical protein BWY39_01168 [Spirochaetes bacterium ADurb.Bin269]